MKSLSHALIPSLLLLLPACGPAREQPASPVETTFQPASPADVGLSDEALARLSSRVEEMVDEEMLVGGELLVIKNRRIVFREAYGWKDREAGERLEPGAVYCVRSMTKPFVGTAVQMLLNDGTLQPTTPVHEILPSFDRPDKRAITIEHLLTHTSGLPFTTIGKPLAEYPGLRDVADEAAATALQFEPGHGFQYSDAGSDTLGAVVEALTGMKVEAFIQTRILDPLQMTDSYVLLDQAPEVRGRIPSAYSGGTGAWKKHWGPEEPPIFPLFLTSQSLYATTTDYARFLEAWLDAVQGTPNEIVSADASRRGVSARNLLPSMGARFDHLRAFYGQQWIVYADAPEGEPPRPVVFGHDGSDGTHAWAWPEQDLMVLFFTQSRGTMAGIALEPVLQRLLVDQDLDTPERPTATEQLDEVAGLYWDETARHAYYVVEPRGRGLSLERPGRMRIVLVPADEPGRFEHEAGAPAWVEFIRDETGTVTAMRTSFGGTLETDPRHTPATDLPSVADVTKMVADAHNISRLDELGVVRMQGALDMPKRGLQGRFDTMFDATRIHASVDFGPAQEVFVDDGTQAFTFNTSTGLEKLERPLPAHLLLDRMSVRYGDWTQHFAKVEVLKRITSKDRSVLLVRVVPAKGSGATLVVDESTGRVIHVDSLLQVPGLGILGMETDYGDFRDVEGMNLPFKIVTDYATPLLGTATTTVEKVETRVNPPTGSFEPPRP